MVTIIWWLLIAFLLCLGFLGCFINKIPGPIAVVLATVVAILGLDIPISWGTVGVIAALAIASIIASKVLVSLAKKMQEYSKRASIGTTIGSIGGLLILSAIKGESFDTMMVVYLIACLIILPFVLAFLLELTNKNGAVDALKCATSATCAYVADTFLKLIVFVYAIYLIFEL